MFKRKAFTLAEVLITLAIIGIVAAITIPTLITGYKEKVTVTKLKKVYSTLSRAMVSVVDEYGTVDTWGLTPSNTGTTNDDGKIVFDITGMGIVGDRFGKYLKHERLAPDWGEDIVETNMQQVPLEQKYNYKGWPAALQLNDGAIVMIGQIPKNTSSCTRSDASQGDYCTVIMVYFPDNTKKRIEGVNQFSFYVMKNSIIPWGMAQDKINPFNTNCKLSNNNRQSGRGCAAWALYNGNMDYLHCEDISWDGKQRCKE